MKYKIVLLLLLLPAITRAQQVTRLDSMVRNVIAELKDSWTLGVDSNSNTVDIAMYNKYKSLFDVAASVDDDLNFQFIPGKNSGTYKLLATPREFDVYAHDAALQISKFRVDSVGPQGRLNIEDSIIYEIRRIVYVEKPARYVLSDADGLADSILSKHPDIRFENKNANAKEATKQEILGRLKKELAKDPDDVYKFYSTSDLRIVLAYTTDSLYPVKIISIRNIANLLSCINDDDKDGVLNAADSLPGKYGEFTAAGAPDDDLDGVTDADDRCRGTYGSLQNKGCPESYFVTNGQLNGAIGLQFNLPKTNLPALDELGYRDESGADAMDVLQSKTGSLKSSTAVSGIYAGGNVVYFFGKDAKRTGISAGFSYSRCVTNYELADPIVYTYKSSDGHDFYRRQITISRLTEKMAINVVNIPVQLHYRFKVNAIKNWVINLKAGPSFILINGLTDYNATIDVGGIYQIDTVNKDKITYYDFFDKASSGNVYLTSSGINQQNSNPGAAAIFDQLNSSGNYDFASNKIFRDQRKISRVTAAFNFSLDAQYRRSRNNPMAIKAGIHFVYAPSIGSNEKYTPIERTTDEYNSIFNSNGRSVYFAYGVTLGLVYDF